MKDVFNDLYEKIISESVYDYQTQKYWLKKSEEIEQQRRDGELELQEDEIELNGNEFEASLRQGAYQAWLEGTVEGKTIHWSVRDYNSDFDDALGIEINGESEGTRQIGQGQTAEMVLSNLYAEFKDAFADLDIRNAEGDDWEEDQDGEQDLDYESKKPSDKEKIIKEEPYDSFSQDYWLNKSDETEEMRRNGELELQEDEIELTGDEFEAHLRQGAYSADLTGTVEGNTIHWEVSDYNSDFDGPLEITIDGESEGTREIGEGQTAEMVLDELYAEFKDAFEELDIRDAEGLDVDDQEEEDFEEDQNEDEFSEDEVEDEEQIEDEQNI